MKLTYVPVEDLEEPATKADLYNLYIQIQFLYDQSNTPEKVIQIELEK
jgi:hypothetical protein